MKNLKIRVRPVSGFAAVKVPMAAEKETQEPAMNAGKVDRIVRPEKKLGEKPKAYSGLRFA